MSSALATAFISLVPKIDTNAAKVAGTQAGSDYGTSFTSKLGTAAKVGAAAFAAVAVGAGVATKAIVSGAKQVAEYGDNVDKMSQKIGMSAKSYQQWDYVLKRAGTDVSVLKTGMKTLSNAAQNGSDAFDKLGISQEKVKSMSKEDLFKETVKGLSKMEAGTERSALATKLLGKAGTELEPLLNEGTDAIEEQMEMAEKYGMVMSDEAVKASADFEDSLTTLDGAFTGLKNRMMGDFLPSLTEITDGVALLATGDFEEGIAKITDGIKDFAGTIGEKAAELIGNVKTYISEHGEEIAESAFQLWSNLVDAIADVLPKIGDAIGKAIPKIVAFIVAHIPDILRAAVKMFGALATAVGMVVVNVGTEIGKLFDKVVGIIKGKIDKMRQVGKDVIQGLIDGFGDMFGAVISKITGIATGIIDKIKALLGIHSPSRVMREIGKYTGEGLALGIDDSAASVSKAWDSVTAGIVDKSASMSMDVYSTASSAKASQTGAQGASGGITINNLTVHADDVLTADKFVAMMRQASAQYA